MDRPSHRWAGILFLAGPGAAGSVSGASSGPSAPPPLAQMLQKVLAFAGAIGEPGIPKAESLNLFRG